MSGLYSHRWGSCNSSTLSYWLIFFPRRWLHGTYTLHSSKYCHCHVHDFGFSTRLAYEWTRKTNDLGIENSSFRKVTKCINRNMTPLSYIFEWQKYVLWLFCFVSFQSRIYMFSLEHSGINAICNREICLAAPGEFISLCSEEVVVTISSCIFEYQLWAPWLPAHITKVYF